MQEINSEQLKQFPEYDRHKRVYEINEPKAGLHAFIAIHRKNNDKPSFGATRLWPYLSQDEGLRDALNLSKIMSYKAALADFPYGGAKGVIISPKSLTPTSRRNMLRAYAQVVNALHGDFITGSDVGVDNEDVRLMRRESPFIVGLNTDPTICTALGLFSGIKTCLKEVFGDENSAGRSFAIQGIGKIGSALVDILYPHTSNLYISDVSELKLRQMKQLYPNIKIVNSQESHRQAVDVYSPCALSNILNAETIPELCCKIVAGGANNQLLNREAGRMFYDRGILYAPDYVINAGGLISVIDEYEHVRYNKERIAKRIESIADTLNEIFSESKKVNIPANEVADKLAEKIFNTYL